MDPDLQRIIEKHLGLDTVHIEYHRESIDMVNHMIQKIMQLINGERVWWCEYPEFNDPHCQSGMADPKPDEAWQPRKHTACRWVLLLEIEEES